MAILCPDGFCGMSPKAGATVAAVYMALVMSLYLIFEVGHCQRALLALERAKPLGNVSSRGTLLPYCYYAGFALAAMTYPACGLLLYALHRRHTRGLLAYATWVTCHDLASCLLLALRYHISREAWFSLSPLEWFGLGTRLPMDCFWLSFVVTHALLLAESKGQGRLSLRPRRVSRNVSEPPRFRLGTTVRKAPAPQGTLI